jgi:hypothetical protein
MLGVCSHKAAKKAFEEQASGLQQQLKQAREDQMRAESKLKDVVSVSAYMKLLLYYT